MVDNGEKILVEFDYDNISIIDPNKVIDDEGKVKNNSGLLMWLHPESRCFDFMVLAGYRHLPAILEGFHPPK